MKGTVLYGPHDIRFEERDAPKIIHATDAIIRIAATCVCGSDLWPYRGINKITEPTPMGHEYCGVVEEVGKEVKSIKREQFVSGSFFASDNTCPHCHTATSTPTRSPRMKWITQSNWHSIMCWRRCGCLGARGLIRTFSLRKSSSTGFAGPGRSTSFRCPTSISGASIKSKTRPPPRRSWAFS